LKAIVYERYGPPSVLQLRQIDKPVPQADEILIKVHATTAATGDWRLRKADPVLARIFNGLLRPERVQVLGFELAGIVESTGSAVTRFRPGDAVYAACGMEFGAYAEYKCMSERGAVAPMPANMTFEEAAAVPVGGYTAMQFLRKANVQRGNRILVYGASGSVGTYAVQLAKHYGAEVTGVCSAPNVELVSSLGADRVIDYTKEQMTDSGETYDIIFDAAGKGPFRILVRRLTPNGRLLRSFHVHPLHVMGGMWVNATSGRQVIGGTMKESAEDLMQLKELIEAGMLRSVIDRRYPLEKAAEAHRYAEQGHKRGNVVLTVP